MINIKLPLLIAGLAASGLSLGCAHQGSDGQGTSSQPESIEEVASQPSYEPNTGPGQGGSDVEGSCAVEKDNSVASSGEGPSFLIVSPRHGQILEPGDVTVSIDVTGFKLVDNPGLGPTPGEGRILFYRDPAEIPVEPRSSAGSGPGTYDTDETAYTFINLAPGCHRFAVQLIDNDGTPLDEPKVASVPVTVRP